MPFLSCGKEDSQTGIHDLRTTQYDARVYLKGHYMGKYLQYNDELMKDYLITTQFYVSILVLHKKHLLILKK